MYPIYLTFTSENSANAAQNKISENMVVGQWADVHKCPSEKWVFIKPDNQYMTGVTDYLEEELQVVWYSNESPPEGL